MKTFNLELNNKIIAEDITAFKAFTIIALCENFRDATIEEVYAAYYAICDLVDNIAQVDYIVYNLSENYATIQDFILEFKELLDKSDY